MSKTANVAYPVNPLIAERWSPRAFLARPVDREVLGSLLEAARWAPSCYNAQPWRFLVAMRDDPADPGGYERMASTLMDGNSWAKAAPVLLCAVARADFEHNDKPNRHAWHDVGLAVGNLILEAQDRGLATHQMAGFDAERARSELGIPAGYDPVSVIALGYAGEPASLPDPLAEREAAPRDRKPLADIVRGAGWDASLEL